MIKSHAMYFYWTFKEHLIQQIGPSCFKNYIMPVSEAHSTHGYLIICQIDTCVSKLTHV